MKYFSPRTLNETLILMKKWKGKAKLIAGGTNVIRDLRVKAIKPQALIDISYLKGVSYIDYSLSSEGFE